jgi:predicted alpha/beta superfamily hydrolase
VLKLNSLSPERRGIPKIFKAEEKDKNEQLLKLLRGLHPRNYRHKLQQMQRKHDEMVAQKNIKKRRLELMYKELDGLTHANLQEDVAEI